MKRIIVADFTPKFREETAKNIKQYGVKFVEWDLITKEGRNPSFVRGLIRSIMRKEGW